MGQQRKKLTLRAKHWTPRKSLEPGSKNILFLCLVEQKKILLPPFHIKLGIMKQFVKAFPKTGNCFKYLYKTLHHLSDVKLKEGVFVGPDMYKKTYVRRRLPPYDD
jgi:hypothetical protein